jgi:NAD(P)-dependent dehydrogenase (short-subunit alcohol dehydrogenase family)
LGDIYPLQIVDKAGYPIRGVGMSFDNKVAFIAGGTGALGRTVTRTFLDAGAYVAATFIVDKELQEIQSDVKQFDDRFTGIHADLLNEAHVKSAVRLVLEDYKRIDFLINATGGFIGGVTLSNTTLEQFDRMVDLNIRTAFLCSKHVIPIMKRQKSGRIVNIGAKGGLRGMGGMAVYSSSKAAVMNLTQAIAEEVRGYNITANAVVPGIIDTPANRKAMPKANVENWVKPDSIAEVILFLCSEKAEDISSAVIPVFGKS